MDCGAAVDGRRRHGLCTLNNCFYIPFFRDILLVCGLVSVSRESMKYLLDDKFEARDDGCIANAAVVVVGGYKKVQKTQKNIYKFYLKNRKCLLKIGLETGALIIPGENDVIEMNLKLMMPLRKPIITSLVNQ
ncbi:hypothetical protein PVAND_000216 [Polypedilum vanderplanki]|uniref:Uncharacterized protein n=1 Tax=Polypedilum vanderplanki TaxID=319348 RepID=A0A9J6BKM6_POLVA|nr:hypothetical protein PVAND_000216 [Polypedilum vanderplanki]